MCFLVSAAVRNHWPENSTEPHTDNIAFDQNPEDFQTVGSKEGTSIQTSKMSHTSSEAPEDVTLLIEKASAEGRKEPSRRTDSTLSPTEHSPESARVLTSQGSIFCEFLMMLTLLKLNQSWKTFLPHSSLTVPIQWSWAGVDQICDLSPICEMLIRTDEKRVQICQAAWSVPWHLHAIDRLNPKFVPPSGILPWTPISEARAS